MKRNGVYEFIHKHRKIEKSLKNIVGNIDNILSMKALKRSEIH